MLGHGNGRTAGNAHTVAVSIDEKYIYAEWVVRTSLTQDVPECRCIGTDAKRLCVTNAWSAENPCRVSVSELVDRYKRRRTVFGEGKTAPLELMQSGVTRLIPDNGKHALGQGGIGMIGADARPLNERVLEWQWCATP